MTEKMVRERFRSKVFIRPVDCVLGRKGGREEREGGEIEGERE